MLPDVIENVQHNFNATGLYQRSGAITRVVQIKEDNVGRKNKPNEYAYQLKMQQIVAPTLKKILMEHMTFEKKIKSSGGYVDIEVQPTHDLLAALINEAEYPKLPVIKGISECPFMRKSGTICDKPGFDFESGYFYNPSIDFGQVAENPTLEDAKNALERLVDIFCDFPFVEEYYRYVPVAAILSILARPMFVNTPIFVIESSTAGTGKSLISDVISLVTTGRIAPKQTWPEGRESAQELEKLLSAIAMDGTALLMFDNISRYASIHGAPLDKVTTSNGYVKFRILGKSEVKEVPWNTVICFTGNNIVDSVCGDTRRRVIPCRMEPDCEHPENRSGFKYPYLIGSARDMRTTLINDGLTLLRYHSSNGLKYDGDLLGSFEDWTRVVVGAIRSAGGPDIMEAAKKMREVEDDDYNSTVELLRILKDKFINGATTADIIKRMEGTSMREGYTEGDIKLQNAVESVIYGRKNITARVLGKYLSSQAGRIFNGLKIVKIGVSHKTTRWSVVEIGDIK